MARTIGTEVVRQRYQQPVEAASAAGNLWRKLGYMALGSALTLLLALLFTRFKPASEPAAATTWARLTVQQIQAETRLFRELERLFPDNLRWVVQSNGDLGLGVVATANVELKHTPATLVRLVVVRRRMGDKSWQPAWNADVIVRDEELVEVTPNREKGNKLALWVYPLSDGALAVDTSLAFTVPANINSRVSTMMRHGHPAEIAALRSGDWECRVLQTVFPLDDAGKASRG
ncbi:MAG: hypothetical protein NTV49_12960 [Kiritimatiellaeota bacterium]|nr:hypothetical protein [Kiritimatiellota bacterium]